MKVLFLLFFVLETVLSGPPKCCTGGNIVFNRHCLDGSFPHLKCSENILIMTPEEFSQDDLFIEKVGNTYNDDSDTPELFCSTKLKREGYYTENVYLVCYDPEENDDRKIRAGAVLGFISVFFITLTIVVYSIVPKLLDVQGKCIIHALAGLGLGYLFLGIIQVHSNISQTLCQLFPFIIYASFIYSFVWLNILSFNIWKSAVKPRLFGFQEGFWLILYHIFGIGTTSVCLLVLIFAHVTDLPQFDNIKPGIGEGCCWFKSLRETFLYFYGPISVLLFLNLVYYIWTMIELWRQINNQCNKKNKMLKCRLKLAIKLFFIMGLSWIFEVISAAFEKITNLRTVWVILDAINGLEGVFIFLILVVFCKRVRKGLMKKKIYILKYPHSWKTTNTDEEETENQEESVRLSTIHSKT